MKRWQMLTLGGLGQEEEEEGRGGGWVTANAL